ncbi:hypothetical protein BJY01DRAFT_214396 [Aspergillus pseudoustus]|uniref:Uncharacterized protein n=1 Tax=Aspergillus pseudoustus TaxID=1810923 RepID=A0ABR4JYQ1_9EURO
MSQQQRQIQSVDVRTKKILTVVEQQASSQALVQHRPSSSISASSMSRIMPEPSILRELCDQQQLMDSWLRRKQRRPTSEIGQLSQYCTCRQKPQFGKWSKPRSLFSIFTLHEISCPLHAADHRYLALREVIRSATGS